MRLLVRMLVQVSGTRNGQSWPGRGQSVDLPDGEAAEYCAAGMAVPVATHREAEKAVPPVREETRDEAPPQVRVPQALTTETGPAKRRTR